MARKPKSKAPDQVVTVRMYKNILGDCFLLRIAQTGKAASHVLIDCGILQGVPGDKARMQAIADDIVRTTNGRLDLLVVTHEHHDHISGFAHAAEVFFTERLKIDALWMAWTENEADAQARALDLRFNKAKLAVTAAADRATALGLDAAATRMLSGLQKFIGPIDRPGEPALAGRLTGRVIMRKLKEKVRASGPEATIKERVRFLEPGQVLATPGSVSLRASVLGPPRKPERLFQDLPTRHDGEASETYLDERFSAADDLLSLLPSAYPGKDHPFAPRYGFTEAEVRTGSKEAQVWIRTRYYGDAAPQTIDNEWLGSAGALALKLDSDTNNTSLALAFETENGHVLVFAADAQVGNWLSWHDQTYGDAGTTATDLLKRAVFYKVGHHASHNATLRDQGLELMTGGDLVAMIPVVEEVARSQGTKGWNMPYPALLGRLKVLTGDRVIRGDQAEPKGRFSAGRLRTDANDLWVEYDVWG